MTPGTMMRRLFFLTIAITAAMTMVSCNNKKPVIAIEEDNSYRVKENMINANRVVIQSENTQIESYLSRHGWEMELLPCGALYMTTQKGQGNKIEPEETVVVSYRLEGLDGKPIYTHQMDTLKVGKREVTVALDQVLQQLTYGSQARVIAPSNSAYGVVGDGDRVQPRTVIVYNINDIRKIETK